MEENKPEKIIIGYRQKKKSHKKGFITLFIFCALVFLALAIVCFTRQDSDLNIAGGVLIALAAAYFLLIFAVVKRSNIIDKVNTYPETALVIYENYLCIVRDQIEKIKLTEIEKVSKTNDTVVVAYVKVRKSSGTLTIRANGEKYNVYQLVNVDETLKAIKHYMEIAKSNQ